MCGSSASSGHAAHVGPACSAQVGRALGPQEWQVVKTWVGALGGQLCGTRHALGPFTGLFPC